MIIEMFLFLAFVVAAGAVIVKAYEWRQEVLYGPYIVSTLPHQSQMKIPRLVAVGAQGRDQQDAGPALIRADKLS